MRNPAAPNRPPPLSGYLLALEGGGTRSQAALLDGSGLVLQLAHSSAVNTNFVPLEQARQAACSAVQGVLQAAGIPGEAVTLTALALVGAHFAAETLGQLLPNTSYQFYSEREVIFAQAGIYLPHGVALVAATGATAFGIRADDGRQIFSGGWGSLLGDEGSAYALGLQGLRAAARAFEGRLPADSRLVEAVCEHFHLHRGAFRQELVALAYQKQLSRAEIAGFAVRVTQLAAQGDRAAIQLTERAAGDLAALALHACRQLFSAAETFDLVAAGGLTRAGEMILQPLRHGLSEEFPYARLHIGSEEPAAALAKLVFFHFQKSGSHDVARSP